MKWEARANTVWHAALLVLALGLTPPVAAQVQVPVPPAATVPSTPPAAPAAVPAAAPAPPALPVLPEAELLRLLRAGGLVVYFRHTATDFSKNDVESKSFDDCANQRALLPLGRTQAREIGAAWKRLKIPAGQVLASPTCRTRDVAQLMFGRYERSNDVRGGPMEDGSERYAGLKRLMSTPPLPPSANLVISSHGNPYQALAGAGSPYLAEGESAVIRPHGDGRWEVLARIKVDGWARLK